MQTPADVMASRKQRRKTLTSFTAVVAPVPVVREPLWHRALALIISFVCLPVYFFRTALNWLRNTIIGWLTLPRELIAGEGQLLEKLEAKVSTLESRLKAVKKQKNKDIRKLREVVEKSPYIGQPLAPSSSVSSFASAAPPPPPPLPVFAAPRAVPMPPPPPPIGKLSLKASVTALVMPAKPKATSTPSVTLADITGVKLKKAESMTAMRPPLQASSKSSNQPVVSLSDLNSIKLKRSQTFVANDRSTSSLLDDASSARFSGLRKLEVQRSPGGTPMKQVNKENAHSYSATQTISSALKNSVQRATNSVLNLRSSPTASPSAFDSPK